MADGLKSYPVTWKGEVLLACRKCQKKLKGQKGLRALAKLKKTIQRLNKEHPERALHVIGVPCMDLCPKGAVTICFPASRPVRLQLLRTEDEIAHLYRTAAGHNA